MSVLLAAALFALVLAPLLVQQRVTQLRRHRSEVIQPTRDSVSDLQLALAMQMASLRGFAITGDEGFLDAYQENLEQERVAFERLELLTARIGPQVTAERANLHALARRWREGERRLIEGRRPASAHGEQIQREQHQYERTLEASMTLRDALLDEAADNRQAIREAERLGFWVHVMLALVGMGATFMLLWVGSRLRRLAQEAEQGRALAEQAGATKARMVRGVGHDLRNPLGVVAMAAALLEEEPGLDGTQRKSVNRIRRSVDAMNEIIADLLEVARRDGGAIRIRRELVDVAQLARATAEDHRPNAEARDLELSIHLTAELPRIETDPIRVREILRNLLSNAIKYTPPGGRLRLTGEALRRDAAPTEQEWVALHVIDTGPGIPPDARERIFEELVQLDSRNEGLGIGLSMSRRVAKMLGGDLTVESRLGHGARFTLWLPVG